ncbi:MAG: phosphoenolpyruvate--protein phosphotransferase [Oligosphaeraceae bacterium]
MNASLLPSMQTGPDSHPYPPHAGNGILFQSGTPLVPGVCHGRCLILAGDEALKEARLTRTEDLAGERRRLQEAVVDVRESLQASARQIREVLTEADEKIFPMYESLLEDPTLLDRIEKFLQEGLTLPSALSMASASFQEDFQQIQDQYLRERLLDVQDVLLRLMEATRNAARGHAPEHTIPQDDDTPIVLVARELFPSQFLSAPLKRVRGIVCETGGPTSHTAILARALRIPMMVDVPAIQEQVTIQDTILVDCQAGLCYINPARELLDQYALALQTSRRDAAQDTAAPPVDDAPATKDGTVVHLRGNVTLFSEVPALHAAGVREVGLYRTEFMFLIRNAMPDEETQYRVLRRLVEGSRGAHVVIRALDIGGDKPLSYIQWDNELNPSLGWRGLRFLLTNPDFSRTHLRAILRTCTSGNVKLLFPMVSDMGDIQRIKSLVREAMDSLKADGIPYGCPPIGMMLETPSAVLSLERLLPHVDFASIGTNDLVQYLFAVDRGNGRVKQWYQQCHPIVLRLLGDICRIMAKFPEKDLEICGEMAGNLSVLPALLGAGLRNFSMNPVAIPAIREKVRRLDLAQCQELYQKICGADTPEEVQDMLDQFPG